MYHTVPFPGVAREEYSTDTVRAPIPATTHELPVYFCQSHGFVTLITTRQVDGPVGGGLRVRQLPEYDLRLQPTAIRQTQRSGGYGRLSPKSQNTPPPPLLPWAIDPSIVTITHTPPSLRQALQSPLPLSPDRTQTLPASYDLVAQGQLASLARGRDGTPPSAILLRPRHRRSVCLIHPRPSSTHDRRGYRPYYQDVGHPAASSPHFVFRPCLCPCCAFHRCISSRPDEHPALDGAPFDYLPTSTTSFLPASPLVFSAAAGSVYIVCSCLVSSLQAVARRPARCRVVSSAWSSSRPGPVLRQRPPASLRPTAVVALSEVAYPSVSHYSSLGLSQRSATHEPVLQGFASQIGRALPQPRLTTDRQERLGGGGGDRRRGGEEAEEERRGQCSDPSGLGPEELHHMSHRSGTARAGSISPREPAPPLRSPGGTRDSRSSLPPGYGRSSNSQEPSGVEVGPDAAHASRASPSQRSPVASVGSSSARSARASDVRSILNPSPTAADATAQVGQRRNSDHLDSPQRRLSMPPLPFSTAMRSPLGEQPPGDGSAPAYQSANAIVTSHAPRRILTPKSPSLRVSSLNRTALPGTIDAQKSPFLSSQGRSYATEAGTPQGGEVPLIPTPPIMPRLSASGYGFPTVPPSPPAGSRRASASTAPATHSQSASPSTSYSSFGQPGQTSPAPLYGNSSNAHAPSSAGPASAAYGSSIPALGQSSYPLLTLDTDQGLIPVPVDVQAASKMADDKRKRNAGASARFRQRRKEKEREASQTIAKLEQQLREATEERELFRRERDMYQRERDHFRNLAALAAHGGSSVSSRGPSSPQAGPSATADAGGMQLQPGPGGNASGGNGGSGSGRVGAASAWHGAVPGETTLPIARRRSEAHLQGSSLALPPLVTNASPSYAASPTGPPSFHNSPASLTPAANTSPSTSRPETYGGMPPSRYGPGWFPGPENRGA